VVTLDLRLGSELARQEIWDEFRAEFQGRGPEQVGFPTFNAEG